MIAGNQVGVLAKLLPHDFFVDEDEIRAVVL